MRLIVVSVLLAAFVFAGCTTKSAARAKARRAYVAGQQQALAHMHMQQAGEPAQSAPMVVFVGPVKNAILIWSSDLTLVQALVEAEYQSATDPAAIIIHRNGEEISIALQRLLSGEDILLEAGDIVQIQP